MEIKTVLKWCFIIIIKHLESILCALDPLDIHCSSFVMWSSKMSWNSLLYWFLDRAINSIQFPLYFIVLCIAKMAIYRWNRMRNVDGVFSGTSLQIGHTMKMKTELLFCSSSADSFCLIASHFMSRMLWIHSVKINLQPIICY